MTHKQFAEEIVRGAFNKTDSPFRESEIYRSMRGDKEGLCHGHTALMLRKAKFNPNLYIVLMGGPTGLVAHSALADDRGIKYDRDKKYLVSQENNEVTYIYPPNNKGPVGKHIFTIVNTFKVQPLIGKYMNQGTYIQVEPTTVSKGILNSLMFDAGIPIVKRKKDLHSTLMYSPTKDFLEFVGERKYVPKVNTMYTADLVGVDILGDDPIKSLVIKLDCPALDQAHSKMKAAGLKHTYPELNQHITVVADDIKILQEYKVKLEAVIAQGNYTVVLTGESASALKIHG